MNPEILYQDNILDTNMEFLHSKTILIQKELLEKHLEKERELNSQLSTKLEEHKEDIAKLNARNEELFQENYELLKYKFLYE